jgi:hypothetical protein
MFQFEPYFGGIKSKNIMNKKIVLLQVFPNKWGRVSTEYRINLLTNFAFGIPRVSYPCVF